MVFFSGPNLERNKDESYRETQFGGTSEALDVTLI